MKKINAVLFDFDGVLTKDKDDVVLLVNLLKEKTDLSEESLITIINKHFSVSMYDGRIDFLTCWDALCSEIGVDTVILEDYLNLTPIDEAMVALAKKLKENYRVGIITTNSSYRMKEIITRFQLGVVFEDVFISADMGVTKREKEIFQQVLERLDLSGDEVVFIDNSARNLVEAEKVGIHTIFYTFSESSYLDLKQNLEHNFFI